MAGKTDQKPTAETAVEAVQSFVVQTTPEKVWLDMQTREIVRDYGSLVYRSKPSNKEFDDYANLTDIEKRNDSQSVA